MEQPQAPVAPLQSKSQKTQTIGILMLISGIVNILVGLGGGLAFALTLFLICCAPIYLLPIVLGGFEIYYASKLLSASGEKVPYGNAQAMAILEICTILVGNVISAVLGIINLVLLNDPEAKADFR